MISRCWPVVVQLVCVFCVRLVICSLCFDVTDAYCTYFGMCS